MWPLPTSPRKHSGMGHGRGRGRRKISPPRFGDHLSESEDEESLKSTLLSAWLSQAKADEADNPGSEYFQTSTCSSPEIEEYQLKAIREMPKPKPMIEHVAHEVGTYFYETTDSHRLHSLSEAPVKLLKVVDKSGILEVAFKDEQSKLRYKALCFTMEVYYNSATGHVLAAPTEYFQHGDVFAARVTTYGRALSTKEDSKVRFRRVKLLQTIDDKGKEWIGRGIDDSRVWKIERAYPLYPEFGRFPAQVHKVRIMNWSQLFDSVVDNPLKIIMDHKNYKAIIREITSAVMILKLRKVLTLKNISYGTDNMFAGDLGQFSYKDGLYMEAVYQYFTPHRMIELNEIGEGTITWIYPLSREFSLCSRKSLMYKIQEVINEKAFVQRCEEKQVEFQKNWIKKYDLGQSSRLLLVHDDNKVHRAKVKSFNRNSNVVTVTFLDQGRDGGLSVDQILCSLVSNNDIPALIAAVPGQAVRYRMSKQESTLNYSTLIGATVIFKVVKAGTATINSEVDFSIIGGDDD